MQDDRKQNGPGALERNEAANLKHRIANSSALSGYRALAGTSSVNTLLERLQGVRKHGEAWRADCPLGHSSRGALSVATGDDGRVLLHCFAGCEASDIAAAVGLRLADLYPERVTRMTPEERRSARLRARESNWAAALGVLATEATVCEVAAEMIRRGEPMAADDVERVHTASQRIHGAREVLR